MGWLLGSSCVHTASRAPTPNFPAEAPTQMPPASSENSSMSCCFTGRKLCLIDDFTEPKPSPCRKHRYKAHIPLQIQREEQRFCWKLSVWLGSGTIFSKKGLEQSGGLMWPAPDSCDGPSPDNPCLSCRVRSSNQQEWKDPPARLIQNSSWERCWGNKIVTVKSR